MAITLYQFPGLCSRVTMNALEEIGLDYEDRTVNTRAGEQSTPDYLALNPKGKIPVLVIDGTVLTENAAMLHYLATQYPQANLLPRTGDALADLQGLIDLIWCSSTIHPLVRQVRRPDKLTQGDPEDVRTPGIATMTKECRRMAERIGSGWWYGDRWSIVDTYLYWAYSTAQLGGFPLDEHPLLLDHARRVRARPSFQRVLAREQAALDRLGITDVAI